MYKNREKPICPKHKSQQIHNIRSSNDLFKNRIKTILKHVNRATVTFSKCILQTKYLWSTLNIQKYV